MRQIVIDTETTGFDPLDGHRIVEIGAVELVGHSPTGRTFHRYLNRDRLGSLRLARSALGLDWLD